MKNSQEITPVKGRPMLRWVGKKPLGKVDFYPSQLNDCIGLDEIPLDTSYECFVTTGANFLIHGDNKEILSNLLANGFRGKLDLIYIDPPFDSGANYVKKVKLRGPSEKFKAEEHSLIEQIQYIDIWANDNYLQFMYERLILLRELLSDRGSLFLHCDWHKSHHLRFLLDEVFGEEHFCNEIIWAYDDKFATGGKCLDRNHDTIFHYSKTDVFISNEIRIEKAEPTKRAKREKVDGKTVDVRDSEGNKVIAEYSDKRLSDVWTDIKKSISSKERTPYPTQKKEQLTERILQLASKEDSIVLDCFCGSGTTAAVAECLGRRWIVADINKGSIQTSMRRLTKLVSNESRILGNPSLSYRGFAHFRVNNYMIQDDVMLERLVFSKYGIQIDHQDSFFKGRLDGALVRIIDLNRPLSPLDIQLIKEEINNHRPEETRNIIVVCNGSEIEIEEMVRRELNPINRISVVDIQRDGLYCFEPAEAYVEISTKEKFTYITIEDYISPSILARLENDQGLMHIRIDDFRVQIEGVLIDTNYTGKCFNICEIDFPDAPTDLIVGKYKVKIPSSTSKVAIKIVDVLGEEVMTVQN